MTFISGKRIAITGAGGSIGSELAWRCSELGASRLLLIDNSEIALCRQIWRFPARANIDARLADVRDAPRILELFIGFQPQFVFHCAALKHVPICERDADEAIKTNVNGTMLVAGAAAAVKADAMVLISTDKATDPVCALGRSKRTAEIGMARLHRESRTTRFTAVRFHNVFGSSGSVVERFAEQIARGGPIEVTHPDMVRWFATPREACDLLIACAEHACGRKGRDLYALQIGEPRNIFDIALAMRGDRDIAIVIVGVRPGERLQEKLVGEHERAVDVGIEGIVGVERDEAAMRPAGRGNGGAAGSAEGQASESKAARA